jgi:D-alanyl-D-alanine carboxypeptidase
MPALAAGLLAAGLLAGCGDQSERRAIPPLPTLSRDRGTETSQPKTPGEPRQSPIQGQTIGPSRGPAQETNPPQAAATGAAPPAWLGKRVLPTTDTGYGEVRRTPNVLRHRRFTLPDTVRPLPGEGFAARVTDPAPEQVIARSSWRPGCPVEPEELTWLRLTFWGFDDERHTGELLVHEDVAQDLVSVFEQLYAARFPMEELTVVTREELDAPPTGDGNSTTAFACRPTTGGTAFSQHAYGLAVDVNSFQNPYVDGDLVLPELASAYVDRTEQRPGMIGADGLVVQAFESIGWEWGGSWRTLKDYQHFSRNGH